MELVELGLPWEDTPKNINQLAHLQVVVVIHVAECNFGELARIIHNIGEELRELMRHLTIKVREPQPFQLTEVELLVQIRPSVANLCFVADRGVCRQNKS